MLIDQDGRGLSLSALRGRPLLVTFSFTRCPLEEYCPLMMQRFAAIEKATAADPALRSVRLLTVTLDPEHDTPERLKAYGAKYTGEAGADRRVDACNRAADRDQEAGRVLRAGLLHGPDRTGDSLAAHRPRRS